MEAGGLRTPVEGVKEHSVPLRMRRGDLVQDFQCRASANRPIVIRPPEPRDRRRGAMEQPQEEVPQLLLLNRAGRSVREQGRDVLGRDRELIELKVTLRVPAEEIVQ